MEQNTFQKKKESFEKKHILEDDKELDTLSDAAFSRLMERRKPSRHSESKIRPFTQD
jgi:hypothetical protein